ncbi:MAG TPA: permease, partial [Gemmataceae bacterium]|nr:permease [Gemmataceae bacterium]
MEKAVFDFVLTFVSIIWEAFPFVVLGAIIAGILEEVVPQQAIAKIIPKNKYLAIGIGAVLGLVFPMCECGIVPVMRRLLRKGLPLGTCIAYMLAGPIINLIVIGSTAVAFKSYGIGTEMVALRVGL